MKVLFICEDVGNIFLLAIINFFLVSDIRIDAKRPQLPFYERPIDFLSNNPRCSVRLENALEQIRRRQLVKEKTLNLKGYSLHKQLRTIPYDMYVTDMRVRLPTTSSWVCIY